MNTTTQPAAGQRSLAARHLLTLATGLWIAVIGLGLLGLWSYSQKPGAREAAPSRWPASSQIRRGEGTSTLVFFAHPRCPCTRASIRELQRLTERLRGRCEMFVVFADVSAAGSNWSWTDLTDSVHAIDAAHLKIDREGRECDCFQARTSGLTLLYSAGGDLLFQGGITASRGHEGDNDGIRAIEAIVLTGRSPIQRTAVYGCPLHTPLRITATLASREDQS